MFHLLDIVEQVRPRIVGDNIHHIDQMQMRQRIPQQRQRTGNGIEIILVPIAPREVQARQRVAIVLYGD